MTQHPDKAREAFAQDVFDIVNCREHPSQPGTIREKLLRRLDAYLAASVPAGDHIHQALARLRHQPGELTKEQREFVASVIEGLAAKLTAQKAAHAKILRDEAKIIRAEESAYAAEHLFRMADKIEGTG